MLAMLPIKALMPGICSSFIMAKNRRWPACYCRKVVIPETNSSHL